MLPSEMAEILKNLITDNKRYEVIASLTEKQKKEWDECQQLLRKAEMIFQEAKARKDLLWITIRKALSLSDMEKDLKIEDGILWAEIDFLKETEELPPL